MPFFRIYIVCGFFALASLARGAECPRRLVLLADAWSSARVLAQALEERGIEVHGLQSQEQPPLWVDGGFQLVPGRQLIVFNGDYQQLEAQVRDLGPDEILYGADGAGIWLVDWLAERLGKRGNGTRHSKARTTKTKIQEVLAEKGIDHLRGILTNQLDEAKGFVGQVGGYSVFIKPNDDGGGTLAFRIDSESELAEKFNLILASTNSTTHEPFSAALVQEFADGVEYAVQGTALDGEIKFSSVLRYEKARIDSNTETYQSEWIIPASDPAAKLLMEFVELANPAVEFGNGPFHWELKIRKSTNRVVTIEMNPRLIGGNMVHWLKDCVGYSDVDLVIKSLFFPEEFANVPKFYSVQTPGFVFEVITPRAGLYLDEAALARVRALPGYSRTRFLRTNGGPLPKTKDLDSIAATFDFSHFSTAEVENSYRILMEMQSNGEFFRQ